MLCKKRRLADHGKPIPPFFLKGENLFVHTFDNEIFIKRIYSTSVDIPRRGSVIMAPGIAVNANIFRIDDIGQVLEMGHNRSFANLLASEGFNVYLYHPGYTERTHNRYVARHCRESIYFGKRYRVPSDLSYLKIVETEVPAVIDFVRIHGEGDHVSWIGYSMGGMLIYSFLSGHEAPCIKNVITIGSPLTLSQIFIRIIPYANMTSAALGFEETAFMGTLSENLVPLTRMIRILPGWVLKYNLFTILLFNPLNMEKHTLKAMLGKIVEPIPAALEACFSRFISSGFSPRDQFSNYLVDLRRLRKTDKNFLFFYGPNDTLAPPDSVSLAHEVISPDETGNLVSVQTAGHLDLVVGRNALETVWSPTVNWLKKKGI